MINEHNDAVVSLENALAKYLKGGRLAKSRPTTKLKSFYGLGGEKVDAITHYTEEVKRLETIIVDRREQLDMEDSKPTNYGGYNILFFTTETTENFLPPSINSELFFSRFHYNGICTFST